MIPELRKEFLAKFSEDKYREQVTDLERRAGTPVPFRIAESPLFIPRDFADRAATLAEEIIERAASPELQKVGLEAVPKEYTFADDTPHPLFSAVDFAITGSSESPGLGLIEMQGFPSLYHFQAAFSQSMQSVYDLDPSLTGLIRPIGYNRYFELVSESILAGNDPKETVLLEIGPYNQKTLPDFLLAQQHLGIPLVDIVTIIEKKKELYYPLEGSGKLQRIRRIYNRSIHDEIVVKGITLPFKVGAPHDVTWAGHPNWYYRISKVLLPNLVGTNEAVPNAMLVRDADLKSIDLNDYVLKPLYSFAGAGVNVNPELEDVEGISHYAQDKWLLQEKVHYADIISTTDGHPVKAELRILLIWPEGAARPQAVHTLVRMTRGKMVGVDFNKGLSWVGSSCALIPG